MSGAECPLWKVPWLCCALAAVWMESSMCQQDQVYCGKGELPQPLSTPRACTSKSTYWCTAIPFGEGLSAQPVRPPANYNCILQSHAHPLQGHRTGASTGTTIPLFCQNSSSLLFTLIYTTNIVSFFPTYLTLCLKDFEVSFQYCLFWFNLWHVLALAVNPVFHDKLPSKVLGCAWLRMNVVFLRGWPACCFLYFPVSILPSFRGFLCDLPAFHWFHYHKNLLCHQ